MLLVNVAVWTKGVEGLNVEIMTLSVMTARGSGGARMTKQLKVLDCFSGIGGFALAESFFEGQFETKQFVEINPYCQQVLSKKF